MKKITKLILVVCLLASGSLVAQTKLKIGHIDSNKLLSIMPEKAEVQATLEAHAKDIENTLAGMQDEFEKKYQDYLAKSDSLTPLIKQTKEAELQDLQQRIQTFQTNAQQDYQTKQTELFQPVIEKAKKAIEEVAKENGYTYIIDSGSGALIYFSENSDDVFNLVKAKLGLE
ncbi:MAG: OmpH family outer membrane protein [Chlorobi bacterium]|nr:OmpH family outer membrane protein [Chlorobiota bacterium]